MNINARQAAAVPLNTSFERDNVSALRREPSFQLDGDIPLAEVGQTIPIIFCKRVSGVGGAWTIPTLVRTGLSNLTQFAIFSHALLLSEGQITTPIADFTADVLFGGLTSSALSFFDRINEISYGSLPASLTYGDSRTQQYNFITSSFLTEAIAIGNNPVYVNQPAPIQQTGTGTVSITAPEYCTSLTWSKENGSTDFFATYTQTYPATGEVRFKRQTIDSQPIWDYTFFENGVSVDSGSVINGDSFSRPVDLLLPALTLTIGPADYNPLELNDNTTGSPLFQYTIGDVDVVDRHVFRISIQERPPYVVPDLISDSLVYKSDTAGDFTDMTLFGVKAESFIFQSQEESQNSTTSSIDFINTIYNKQITIFCSNGINVTSVLTGSIGPSSNIADLINYLALKFAKSISINTTDLQTTANFTNANNLFFNGVITTAVNFKEWLETIAPFFLLTPVNLESQISVRPALPITGSNALKLNSFTPEFTFEEQHIAAGSYSVEYVPFTERRPFEAVMIWRDQSEPGLLGARPFNTTVKVRFASDTGTLPQEQYDMSDFCVTQAHALMAAKYILSRRRRITHNVSFTTDLFSAQGLRPGSLIAIELDRINTVGDNRTETTYYLVDSITRSMTGTAQIVGEHFPITAGASVIATDITSGSFTVS